MCLADLESWSSANKKNLHAKKQRFFIHFSNDKETNGEMFDLSKKVQSEEERASQIVLLTSRALFGSDNHKGGG